MSPMQSVQASPGSYCRRLSTSNARGKMLSIVVRVRVMCLGLPLRLRPVQKESCAPNAGGCPGPGQHETTRTLQPQSAHGK